MEYLTERLEVLFEQEKAAYGTIDYLQMWSEMALDLGAKGQSEIRDDEIDSNYASMYTDSSSPPGSKKRKLRQDHHFEAVSTIETTPHIHRRMLWREKLCEWAYRVVDYLRLSREIVFIAMNCFDRHRAIVIHRAWLQQRSATSPCEKEDYALAVMTCLSIAIKLYEYRRILVPGSRSTMDTILKLCGSSVAIEQVEAKEYEILTSLHWRVHPPTPQLFLEYMFMASNYQESTAWNEVKELALYLIEVSTLDYYFTSYRASEIALAALLNATDTLKSQLTNQVDFDFAFLSDIGLSRTVHTDRCQRRLATLYSKSQDAAVSTSETIPRMQSPVSVTADLQD